MLPSVFAAFVVEKDKAGQITAGVQRRHYDELPAGDVVVQVVWTSLNYKDALAATGHPGVTRRFPHVPGIDAAGYVVESASPDFPVGTAVIATGHELGVERWGGWSELIRLPAEWLVRLPPTLTLEEAMLLGTAGFTAAQGVMALQRSEILPVSGPVVVTGASGGVGSLSVAMLAGLGYEVVAVSGKPDRGEWLRDLGARRVIGRNEFLQTAERPLLKSQWSGGIDTVGGEMLSTLVRGLMHRGCVAACGVVGGAELLLTVYPFILRGVTLAGIDSAWCPDSQRQRIWHKLATDWKPERLDRWRSETTLDELPGAVRRILAGEIAGRTIVRINR
ncbi:MAG: acryloyl-CoA reductase [Planctomycetota bacterium]|nr:MAG: acryloyl-CoA reductase [Planctomycetota bacterium]